jgi:hypothetical protein
MNRKAFAIALLLALGGPSAFAAGNDPCPKPPEKTPDMSADAKLLPAWPCKDWFKGDPVYPPTYNADEQLAIYGGKYMNKTAFPPVDLGLGLYERGTYDPRPTFLGQKNPIMSAFMVFGDLRTAGAKYNNGTTGDQKEIAARLNLDMDWQFTPSERVHAFVRPLDKNGSFTRLQLNNGVQQRFVHEFNFDLKTLFFEGDLGAMYGGLTGHDSPRDLPIAIGRVPIATQNGVWIEDAFDGVALGILSAKNSPKLDISNFDLTLFTALDNVATAAVPGTHNAKLYGLAGFFDGLKGYVEFGYGYVDADNHDLSYHNLTAAYSKRYRGKFANSIRIIENVGQKATTKTADGTLLLIENSLVRGYVANINPLTFVPYLNLWAGFKSPQSLARGGDAGGVLRNTGLNFESDGLTGYPTLDATAHDTYGGAIGVEYLFNLDRQIVVEVARVQPRSNSPLPGAETAVGARYQHPISNAWIVRLDGMKGFRVGQKDVYGARLELRRKF